MMHDSLGLQVLNFGQLFNFILIGGALQLINNMQV